MSTPKHILVGTDFSEASQAALALARDYAKTLAAKLSLIHVYSPNVAALGPAVSLAERMQIGREVHTTLAQLKDRTSGVENLHAEVIEADDPAEILCAYAEKSGVDLIVVGSHGRSGLKRLLLGSVAQQVVRLAPCSVLIARERTLTVSP